MLIGVVIKDFYFYIRYKKEKYLDKKSECYGKIGLKDYEEFIRKQRIIKTHNSAKINFLYTGCCDIKQIEEILSDMISIKQNYSLSDEVYCCMMINQKTLDKKEKIIEDA